MNEQLKSKVIKVDDISSITNSIFSFKHKERIIEALFPSKNRSKEFHEVPYHLDEKDLMKISEHFSDIFPYSMRGNYKEYEDITRNEYTELMKYILCEKIRAGTFNNIVSLLGGTDFRVEWDKSAPGFERPSWIVKRGEDDKVSEERVHNIEDYIDVPAPTHGDDIYYRVCHGTVNWGEGKVNKACFILMKYGDKISFRTVSHLITTPVIPNSLSEFDQVMEALQKLRIKHKI